jgi:hypothetical protein
MSSARGRKAATKDKNIAADLIAALKFVSVAQKDEGKPFETHCAIWNGYVLACDGILTAGARVGLDAITACPHSGRLLSALQRCEGTFAVSQIEDKLTVKSGKFRATIPCVSFADIPQSMPHPNMVPIDDSVKLALSNVSGLTDDKETVIHKAATLLQSGVAVATDGSILIEHRHACQLPVRVLLPNRLVEVISKCSKKLVGIGGAENSVTFWFEDESFVKSQLYDQEYPNFDRLLLSDRLDPAPEGMFEGVRKVADFHEKGWVIFRGNGIASSWEESEGAFFECPGVPEGMHFNGDYMKIAEKFATRLRFERDRMHFQNDTVRGVVMALGRPG